MLNLEVITTETCGCCHDFLNMLKEYVKVHKDVTYTQSDISLHKDLNIKGVPYSIVRKNNVEVGYILGNVKADILTMKLSQF